MTEVVEKPIFGSVKGSLLARVDQKLGTAAATTSDDEKLQMVAELDENEKVLALALVKRNAFQLSQTLSPLLGERLANFIFGLGVLGMGFSSIIMSKLRIHFCTSR